MAYNSIDFKPRTEKIADNMKYFFVTKEYAYPTTTNGKKKCTKEQLSDYNKMIDSRKEMFSKLEIGNIVDMGNKYLKMEDVCNQIHWIIDKCEYSIYKIEPNNAMKYSERYASSDEIRVSSFKIVKRMETIEELLDDLSTSLYCEDAFNQIFNSCRYKSLQNRGIELFKYFKEKYSNDNKIYLSTILFNDLHRYDKHARYGLNDKYVEEYAQELYSNGLIELMREYEDHELIINQLILSGWFKFALDYINSVKSLDYGNTYFKNGLNKDSLQVIKEHTDDKYVVEIIKVLNILDIGLTLVIKEYIDDGYNDRIIEKKIFNDINKAREYVIRQYNITFESAMKPIDSWRTNEEECYIFFEIN